MACVIEVAAVGEERSMLDAQLRRYARSYRRRLRKFAKTSARQKDLLYSFPAAAFAIAAGHGNPMHRKEAVRLVKDGANLIEVADALGLPIWVRRLAPEAFTEPLGPVPGSDMFNRRIANLIPADEDALAMWLRWVLRAHALGDETFALWLARQNIWHASGPDAASILPLAAFAWYSGSETTVARGLITRPWTPKMRFSRAVELTRRWFLRLILEECRDDRGTSESWFRPQRTSGFRIVPLRTVRDLTDEGARMNNCVASYAGKVAVGECLIYGIRRGNRSVATLEVRPHWSTAGTPMVAQLLGPSNETATEDVIRAVETWLQRQGAYPFTRFGQFAGIPLNEQRWLSLWEPYCDARPAVRIMNHPHRLNSAIEQLEAYAH